jgi:chromosome partitioning protein
MKIITIGNIKGGTGKTTLTANLCYLFSNENKIFAIDTDTQKNLFNFYQINKDKNNYKCLNLTTTDEINKFINNANGIDTIIFDAGGRLTETFVYCCAISDLILIPITASIYNVWSLLEFVNFIKTKVKIKNKDLKELIIPNLINPITTKLNNDFINTLKELKLNVSNTIIHNRVDFCYSSENGQSVIEFASSSKAAEEIINLYNEIKNIIY